MGEPDKEKTTLNPICMGLVAHVDAGKTTLSEAILYRTGAIRKMGRVDHGTSFLDSGTVERERGITVFSKEARFDIGQRKVTLLDTPGHADFSAEAERTLSVLDMAVLIVSGPDGVQSHTRTLWKLLEAYEIPVFVFVNKMDREEADEDKVMSEMKKDFGNGFVTFEGGEPVDLEELACCTEEMVEDYLKSGRVSTEDVIEAIQRRKAFPVCFGSALKDRSVDGLLKTIEVYGPRPVYGEEFGARVYKISHDKRGVRQTHIKITGGSLRSKDVVRGKGWEEKVDEIRVYSGGSYVAAGEVTAGQVCAVTGLSKTYAGEGLGSEQGTAVPVIEPAVTYRMILPQGSDPSRIMAKLSQLAEEDPTLNIKWDERAQEIKVSAMGTLELEILRRIVKERFDADIDFDKGSVIYKETIAEPAVGIGHFEPLRHYAEVHLLLEPLERGAGLVFDSALSEDELDGNWQRLILTHLAEKEHLGVLTGSPVTDMKITLIAGRGHLKHTEGGDFRQATYRAVRQGLKKARSILLEPMYSLTAEVPAENVGRLLADLHRFGCEAGAPETSPDGRLSEVTATGPVALLQEYPAEVAAYTGGQGRVSLTFAGYGPCACQDRIVAEKAYDSERDLDNPTGSVFCEKGGAIYISWDKVDEAAHISPAKISEEVSKTGSDLTAPVSGTDCAKTGMVTATDDELNAIFLRTYGKSKRDEALLREHKSRTSRPARPAESPISPIKDKGKQREPLLIIDGYNVIFAWDELKELAAVNLDSAREAFIEIMENYSSYRKLRTIAVFDSYKVSGGVGSTQDHGLLTAVFTREAETADKFIEKTVHELGGKYDVRVVTSDRMVQMAALGDGAVRTSSAEFYAEVAGASREIRDKLKKVPEFRNRPFEGKLDV